METKGKLALQLDAEGGSIAVYRRYGRGRGEAEYRVIMVDQAPMLLDDEAVECRRDSGWLKTWPEATQALSRWPWPCLVPRHVAPEVADLVLRSVRDWVGRGNALREGALRRWEFLCQRTAGSAYPDQSRDRAGS